VLSKKKNYLKKPLLPKDILKATSFRYQKYTK